MTRYLEVGTEIAQQVRSGALPPGAPLPAVRVCARERDIANDLDLDFISLVWECYDIALAGDVLGAARPLITALRDPAVQASTRCLGGYDFELAGTVEPLTQSPT